MSSFLKRNVIPQEIRNNTIDTVLLASLFIFAPALVFSVFRSEFTGWILAYTLQIITFCVVFFCYFYRKKLNLTFKFYIIQVSIFFVAVTGLQSFGYFGSAKLFLILLPIFSWFFVGKRVAIASLFVVALTFGIYAFLYIKGYLGYVTDPYVYSLRTASWLAYGAVMVSVVTFCIVLFSNLIRAQEEAHSIIDTNEEKLRFLTENINDIIWVFDIADYTFTYISPSIKKIRGYTPEEFLNSVYTELMPADSRDNAIEELQKVIELSKEQNEVKSTFEVEVFHKLGHTMWMEINCLFRNNPTTNRGEIIGTSRDVTERKNTQRELDKTQERYLLATAASNLGIWDWYVDSDEAYYSDMWKKQIGYEPHELNDLHRTWEDHLHPDEHDDLIIKVRDYIANPIGKFALEFRFRHKNGSYIWIHSRAEKALDKNGKVERLYGTHLDISRLKLNEEILMERNSMLQKINSELDNFVYRISHDIKAPLSSCFGILNMMESEGLINDKNEYYFTLIRNVLTKQDSVIRSILDYSRNSRGELIIEEISLREMVESTFDDLRFMNDSSGKVNLRLDLAKDLAFNCDKNRIQFILNNLIANGIKYANLEQNNPEIVISATRNDHKVFITVTDNGTGIRPDILPHVFKMFYRGNAESSGSGLGLYIVKETVEKLKGDIQITSEYQVSTTVTITLPNLSLPIVSFLS